MAKKAVRNLGHLCLAGPGRQQPQYRIDLHRIRVDDHAAIAPGKLQRASGLAAGGRARYQGGTFQHGSIASKTGHSNGTRRNTYLQS